jgi:hypothetical protein
MEHEPVVQTADNKIAVLNSIYPVSSVVRRSSWAMLVITRITVAGCGFVLLSVGRLLTRPNIEQRHRLYMTLCIPLFVLVAILVIKTVQRRYRGVAQVIRNINEVQLAHSVHAYLSERTLFPSEWKSFGTEKWKEPIFQVSYCALCGAGALGILSVWMLN